MFPALPGEMTWDYERWRSGPLFAARVVFASLSYTLWFWVLIPLVHLVSDGLRPLGHWLQDRVPHVSYSNWDAAETALDPLTQWVAALIYNWSSSLGLGDLVFEFLEALSRGIGLGLGILVLLSPAYAASLLPVWWDEVRAHRWVSPITSTERPTAEPPTTRAHSLSHATVAPARPA